MLGAQEDFKIIENNPATPFLQIILSLAKPIF